MGGHLDLGQDLAHFGQIQRPGWRQLQTAAHALKQQVLNQLFELRDLLADSALGQVEFFCGAREAQVPGHCLKALQCGYRGQMTFVQHDDFSVCGAKGLA